VLILLFACANDQGFGTVTPDEDDDDDRPRSPWDDLDAGTIPDVAFLALWDDVTDIEARDEENDQYPCLPGPALWDAVRSAPRLDVLDVRGQSIGKIELPPVDPYDEPVLQAISPTAALLVTGRYEAVHHAWDVDAAALQATELAAWSPASAPPWLTVRGTERPIDRGFRDLHPTRIGDVLYAAGEIVGGTDPTFDQPVLYAYDLTDDAAPPTVWTVRDLLPPAFGMLDTPPWFAITHLHPSHGELVMQITAYSPAWDGSDLQYAWRYMRFVFLPETGARSWTIDVSDERIESWTEPVHRHTDDERAALFTQYAYEQPDPALLLYDTAREPQLIVPEDSTCLAGLAILDADAPTVMYTRHPPDGPDDYGNSVVVHHAGREVWRFDGVHVGVGTRRAHVRSLVVLE
jgi:hypothetical protein